MPDSTIHWIQTVSKSIVIGSIGSFVLFGCAKTDDVENLIPADPSVGFDFLIPDRAFGEYMVFLGINGVQEREDTLASGGIQINYYLNPDLVMGVNSLQLSKTSGSVSALEAAGIATASQKIADLSGVEFFTGLDTLVLTSNNLTALDLSNNTTLIELSMNFCKVEALDLTGCPLLQKLRFRGSSQASNLIETIDLSQNVALRHLHLRSHNITTIDLSQNIQLIEEIDLSSNPGPDGNQNTEDIVIPSTIYNNVLSAGGILMGVIPG